jgi:hypothetical protein
MALEGQAFQFNLGAGGAGATKMDISLDDMIKQVREQRTPDACSGRSGGGGGKLELSEGNNLVFC